MEIWDAYTKDFEKIQGMTLRRGERIPAGAYHLVCDVIVKHVDGDYLLMQRDSRKTHGGMWEATAGGSALQGETPLECAARELREETGIEAEHLQELGQIIIDDHQTIYFEYLCVTNCARNSIVLQEGETTAYRWVSRDELVHMKENELSTKRIQRFVSELQ